MNRGERIRRTKNVVRRRVKIVEKDARQIDAVLSPFVKWDKEVQRRRRACGAAKKRHPHDCGKTDCGVCRMSSKDYRQMTKYKERNSLPD